MNKAEFFKTLRSLLRTMPEQDCEKVIAFYEEMISDRMEEGISEEEVIAQFGDVGKLAADILEEAPAAGYVSGGKENKVYEIAGSVSSAVELRAKNLSVEVHVSKDDMLRFHYFENDIVRFTIRQHGDALYLEQQQPSMIKWMLSGLFHWVNQPLLLEVPESFVGRLHVESTNAKISAQGIALGGSLTLHTSNAGIDLCDSSAMELEAVTSNGKIEARRLQAEKGVLCRSSNSKVCVDTVTCAAAEFISSNSKVEVKNTDTDGVLGVTTSNGKIVVNAVSGGEIRLKTINGKIEGSIKGRQEQYKITCHTVNGKCNVPNQIVQGPCRSIAAKTVNGNIELTFLER